MAKRNKARAKASAKGQVKTKQRKRFGGKKLGGITFSIIFAGLLVFAGLGFYKDYQAQLNFNSDQKDHQREAFADITSKLQNFVDAHITTADVLASSLSLLPLNEWDETQIAELEQNIIKQNKTLADFKIASNVDSIEPGARLSFAAVNLLQRAAKGKPPLLEFHKLSEGDRIAVARSLSIGESNFQIILLFKASNLKGAFKRLDNKGGTLELRQYPERGEYVVIANKRGASSGEPLTQVLDGSRLKVAYWSGFQVPTIEERLMAHVELAAAFGVLFLLTLLVVPPYSRALRDDLGNMLSMVRDVLENRNLGEYPMKLAGFRSAAEVILRMDSERRIRQATQKSMQTNPAPQAGANRPAAKQAMPQAKAATPQKTARPKPSPQPLKPKASAPAKKTAEKAQMEMSVDDILFSEQVPEADDDGDVSLMQTQKKHKNLDNALDMAPLEFDGGQVSAGGTVNSAIFRAYDIRGKVGSDLSPMVSKQIGQALGSEAQQMGLDTIIVGRDGRTSGPELMKALCDGITAAGCNVIDIGMVPTPILYFATHFLQANSGVMVTGSHNPPDYNGFKIVLGGETLSGEKIRDLKKRIESGNYTQGSGHVAQQQDIVQQYIDRIASDVRVVRPLKVVVDCGNGVAGPFVTKLYQALGCEILPLHCDVDGNFPNHHPDPSQPENLQELIGSVQMQSAHVGLAFDGDGDRLGVVTNNGEIIWPDRQMMLFAKDVLSRNPGTEIVFDVKCSRQLTNVINDNGGRAVMWKTGHSLIKKRLKQSGILAGEMSGHIFFKERWYGFDDALYTGARLLEILSMSQDTSSKIFSEFPNSINTPELRIDVPEGQQYKIMDQLISQAKFPNSQTVTIDGLRVEFPEGWGLVRASNTTPSLVLRFEADNEIQLSGIQDKFKELLQKVNPNLNIPF